MEYTGDTSSLACNIVRTKIFWNSVLSTLNTRFMTLDIKDFYLLHDLAEYEYIFIPLDLIPEEFIAKYKLKDIAITFRLLPKQIHHGAMVEPNNRTTIHLSCRQLWSKFHLYKPSQTH